MPSPRRPGSPSMWYSGLGCTSERADQEAPGVLGAVAMNWSEESEQKRQVDSLRGEGSPASSPVMTQERVIGSLRSSMMHRRRTLAQRRSQLGFVANNLAMPHEK